MDITNSVKEKYNTGTLAWIAISVIVFSTPAIVVSNTVDIGQPQSDVALKTLELIALMLPAIAIAVQIVVNSSYRGALALSGEGVTLRKYTLAIAGTSVFSLFVAVVILIEYLSLSAPLKIALYFTGISMCSMIVPFLAMFLWMNSSDAEEVGALLQSYKEYKKLDGFDDLDRIDQAMLLEIAGLEKDSVPDLPTTEMTDDDTVAEKDSE